MNLSARIKYSIIKAEVPKINPTTSSMSTSTSPFVPPIQNPTGLSPASLPSRPTIITRSSNYKFHPQGPPTSARAARSHTQDKLKIQFLIAIITAKKEPSQPSPPSKSPNSSMPPKKAKRSFDRRLSRPVGKDQQQKNLRSSPPIRSLGARNS